MEPTVKTLQQQSYSNAGGSIPIRQSGLDPIPIRQSGLDPIPIRQSGLDPIPIRPSGLDPIPIRQSGLPFMVTDSDWLTIGLLQLGSGLGLGLGGLDLHFAVLVSVLQSTSMQLLSACG